MPLTVLTRELEMSVKDELIDQKSWCKSVRIFATFGAVAHRVAILMTLCFWFCLY